MGTNLELLEKAISDSGMTYKGVAEHSDGAISTRTLCRRLSGEGEFSVSEVVGLVKALRLDAKTRRDIFLI